MSDRLQARAKAIRARVAVRAWEFRQRHHAKGVWYRLRRILADTEQAYAISQTTAAELQALGHVPLAAGLDLEPPRLWFLFAPPNVPHAGLLAHPISPRLDARLLASDGLVLVRFP